MEGTGTVATADNLAQATPTTPATQTPDTVQSAPVSLNWQGRIDAMFDSQTGNTEQQPTAPTEGQAQTVTDNQLQQPITPAPENLILGKFKSTEDVFAGYKNLESDYGRKSQALSESQRAAETLKAENERLLAEINQIKQTPQPAPTQPAQTEQLVNPEQFMAEFYEKPQEVIAKTVQQLVEQSVKNLIAPIEQKIQPVIQHNTEQIKQANWDSTVQQFVAQKPDFPELATEVRDYIVKRGLQEETDPNRIQQVLDDAYYYARGTKYQPQQQVDPKSYLQDQNFVQENILKNPDIVNAILKSHMQSIQQTPAPTTITGQGTGQGPVMPPNRAKNMNEAGKMFEDMMRGRLA